MITEEENIGGTASTPSAVGGTRSTASDGGTPSTASPPARVEPGPPFDPHHQVGVEPDPPTNSRPRGQGWDPGAPHHGPC